MKAEIMFETLDQVLLGSTTSAYRWSRIVESHPDLINEKWPKILRKITAQKNNPHALNLEIFMRKSGYGPVIQQQALPGLLITAIESGSVTAFCNLFMFYIYGGDIDAAFELCQKYQSTTNPTLKGYVHLCLMIIYQRLEEHQAASEQMELARLQDNTDATFMLAIQCKESDRERAIQLLLGIRERDGGEAAYALAELARSNQEAIELYAEAGSRGYEPAYEKLALLLEQAEDLVSDHQRLLAVLNEGRDQGSVACTFLLARIKEEARPADAYGNVIDINLEEANAYYEEARKSSYIPAIVRLASWQELGIGGSINVEQAIALHKEAMDLGHGDSAYYVATLYQEGRPGLAADWKMAIHYYQVAIEMGVQPAQSELEKLLPRYQFQSEFDSLKLKASELIQSGNYLDPNYEEAKVKATTLISTLEINWQGYLKGEITVPTLRQNCLAAINAAEPTFAKHRGWHALNPILKGLIGILAALTVVPGLLVAAFSKDGYTGTFFRKPETDSAVKLNRFKHNVEPLFENLAIFSM